MSSQSSGGARFGRGEDGEQVGVVKVLPFTVHSAGDYAAAALLVVSPFALGFNSSDTGLAVFYVAAGWAVRHRRRLALATVIGLFALDLGYGIYMQAYGVQHGIDSNVPRLVPVY